MIRKFASPVAVALGLLLAMTVYGQSKPSAKSIIVYQDPG